MAVQIADTNTLVGFPEGTQITVGRTDGTTNVYTKNADGRWEAEGMPTVRSSAFAVAAQAGRVGQDAEHRVGDWLNAQAEGAWYRVMRVCHGKTTFAKVVNERFVELTDHATGILRDAQAQPMPGAWERAAASSQGQVNANLAQERLDQILDSGVIPQEVEHTATVRVEGTNTVTPDHDQARALLGDEAEIRNAGQVQVDWTKEFQITKHSRWDCVCDEVTQADIDTLTVPGEITKWVVTGCE